MTVLKFIQSSRFPHGLVALLIILIFFLFQDYGITTDEKVHNEYGKRILKYYETGFSDKSATTKGRHIFYYGGAFDLTAALVNRYSPFGEYETRHLLNALVGILGIIGTWKLSKLVANRNASFVAALLLLLTPSYFGHMFNNPKDIPFAVGYTWSLYYIIRCFRYFPKIPLSLLLKVGLAIGLTSAIRVGGMILWLYFLMSAIAYLIFPRSFKDNITSKTGLNHGAFTLSIRGAFAFFISYLCMLTFWPLAQLNPFSAPLKALLLISKFPKNSTQLLRGEYIEGQNLPWHYLPEYLMIKLPELLLFGLLLGVIFAARFLTRSNTQKINNISLQYFFVVFAVVFPFIYLISTKGVIYDELRHFLFIIPCLCVISGASLQAALQIVFNLKYHFGLVLVLFFGLLLFQQAYAMVQLHPYQYTYYNSIVGGIKGADGRYELDYWGHSFKEAVEVLENYLKNRDGDRFENNLYRVRIRGPKLPARYFFPKNFIPVRRADQVKGDFVITYKRREHHKKESGAKIGAVRRLGVELSIIKETRQ